MNTVVSLENVNFSYGKAGLRKRILKDVSLTIRAGEIILLTGPSGSGKTTLLTLIGALRSGQQGALNVLGVMLQDAEADVLTRVRRGIGFVFQNHNLLPYLTAEQNVRMAAELSLEASSQELRESCRLALDSVNLLDQAHKYPNQMSGGQNQRVAIARALVRKPRLLLADEPTASLDSKSGREIVSLLKTLAVERETAVLLVTHDNRILDIADRILHMEDGVLCTA